MTRTACPRTAPHGWFGCVPVVLCVAGESVASTIVGPMSGHAHVREMGQSRRFDRVPTTSALYEKTSPPTVRMSQNGCHSGCRTACSITSSATASNLAGRSRQAAGRAVNGHATGMRRHTEVTHMKDRFRSPTVATAGARVEVVSRFQAQIAEPSFSDACSQYQPGVEATRFQPASDHDTGP
jgi:hypothetical protein